MKLEILNIHFYNGMNPAHKIEFLMCENYHERNSFWIKITDLPFIKFFDRSIICLNFRGFFNYAKIFLLKTGCNFDFCMLKFF
jgi:hypothetical protein